MTRPLYLSTESSGRVFTLHTHLEDIGLVSLGLGLNPNFDSLLIPQSLLALPRATPYPLTLFHMSVDVDPPNYKTHLRNQDKVTMNTRLVIPPCARARETPPHIRYFFEKMVVEHKLWGVRSQNNYHFSLFNKGYAPVHENKIALRNLQGVPLGISEIRLTIRGDHSRVLLLSHSLNGGNPLWCPQSIMGDPSRVPLNPP